MLLYLSAFLLMIVCIIFYYNAQIIKYDKEKRMKEYEDIELNENKNSLSKELYFLSFIPPFNRFLDEFNKEESTKKIKDLLLETNSDNYRTFRMKQVISLILVLIFIAFSITTRNTQFGLQSLLLGRQSLEAASMINLNMYLFFSVILMLITFLYPEIHLKNKKFSKKKKEMEDAPVIQNFIIVLVKSGKTMRDVIYEVSQMENCYSKSFRMAYYGFLRSEQEGFMILSEKLRGTMLEETIKVLSTISEYSKQSSIDSLLSIRQKTIEDILLKKRNKGSLQAVMGQASVLLPLLAMFLLGVYPFIQYYMNQAFGGMGVVL